MSALKVGPQTAIVPVENSSSKAPVNSTNSSNATSAFLNGVKYCSAAIADTAVTALVTQQCIAYSGALLGGLFAAPVAAPITAAVVSPVIGSAISKVAKMGLEWVHGAEIQEEPAVEKAAEEKKVAEAQESISAQYGAALAKAYLPQIIFKAAGHLGACVAGPVGRAAGMIAAPLISYATKEKVAAAAGSFLEQAQLELAKRPLAKAAQAA